ncbi:putative glucosamine-6-phosphate isomerase [Clavispora lusitaniae]|uniref:Glucosamine-6-phosphate isomerase n=1 Tax=Clavispora lusitaniae TaxID=36911 RepID=A0ACD0WJH9_CLALS|nr:putative glucosamine-6-phosphate isomerase [Clavispora lusitaniae]QFZ33292.1 putative glucosamine-6-phosphate isomerase [Clavispora lusitaniae]QFZ38963.1 putative glucosamine-6-phosphate isomerase [Clavispora lusitaniae]QFZ44645.1 putative glucosamine-6-phosphate isomerase [Clavispora lusitaniae]QFZ50322.1 putative glucosamine-6-phosphate isomerase [Clavispora lusitaniae]
MHQNIFSSPDAAADFVACLIVRRINDFQPSAARPFVLGLPTGSSPEGVYAKLVQAYKDGKVSFAHVVTFNMDEYVGLRPEHPQSYHYFMYDKLFNHIDIPRANIHILDGLSADPETECANYEAQIRRFGRINLFLGGLGPEGHLAFNEAGSTRNSKTRRVSLAASTVKANSRFFGSEAAVPKSALSVGISTILDNSDEIVLLVFGKAKAWALEKTLYGQASDPQVPSSYLREHKNVTVVCDHAAAGLSSKL